MARWIIHDGPINTAVMAWMRGQGIKPEDVRGYTLTYDAGDLMTIDIRMIMTDEVPAEVTPEGSTLPQVSRFFDRFLSGDGVESWIATRARGMKAQSLIVQALVDFTSELDDRAGSTKREILHAVSGVQSIEHNAFMQAWQKVIDPNGRWVDTVERSIGERWIAVKPRDAADS